MWFHPGLLFHREDALRAKKRVPLPLRSGEVLDQQEKRAQLRQVENGAPVCDRLCASVSPSMFACSFSSTIIQFSGTLSRSQTGAPAFAKEPRALRGAFFVLSCVALSSLVRSRSHY
jgi:hypothetical protein